MMILTGLTLQELQLNDIIVLLQGGQDGHPFIRIAGVVSNRALDGVAIQQMEKPFGNGETLFCKFDTWEDDDVGFDVLRLPIHEQKNK